MLLQLSTWPEVERVDFPGTKDPISPALMLNRSPVRWMKREAVR